MFFQGTIILLVIDFITFHTIIITFSGLFGTTLTSLLSTITIIIIIISFIRFSSVMTRIFILLSNVLTDVLRPHPSIIIHVTLCTHTWDSWLQEFTNCEERQECIGYTTDEANTENVIECPWTTDTRSYYHTDSVTHT